MKHMIELIKRHLEIAGIFSVSAITLSKLLVIIGIILQVTFGIIGATVGLITIYSFLEKKGLLPKWLHIKDKSKE